MRAVLTGTAAGSATTARLDSDLRRSQYAIRFGPDPRLVDPLLEAEFSATAVRVREQAEQDGFAAGYASGEAAGLAAAAAASQTQRVAQQKVLAEQVRRTEHALTVLAGAATSLEARLAPSAEAAEEQLATMAFALLETLFQRELALSTEPGLDAIRRALSLAPRARPVVARLNPADAAALPTHSMVMDGRDVSVLADPSVEPGGCVADCDATRIDAQLSTALDRVRQVLQP